MAQMEVRCSICGRLAAVAMWAKLAMNDEKRGWLCKECYDSLYNVLDQNQA